jgi:hypothetical protein
VFGRNGSEGCTDPRVIFIPWIGRFAVVYYEDGGDGGSPMRFAVSVTPNPTASPRDWYEYATPQGFDQPKIEATKNTLVVSGNELDGLGAQVYVYDLFQIETGVPQPSMQGVFGDYLFPQAVVGAGYSPPPSAYLVALAGFNGVAVQTISGNPLSGNVTISDQHFSTPQIADATEPAIPGGSLGGGRFDNRVLSAVYEVQNSNGHPVIDLSGHTDCNGQGCLYDIKIDLSTTPPRVVKHLTLTQQAASYTYGSVTLDNYGNAYLAYSLSDPNNTPQANAVTDNDANLVGWNSVIQAQAPGTSACSSATDTPPCGERWGDYFGAAQDPSNTSNVWLAAQWQSGNGQFNWGTSLVEANSSGIIRG